MQLKRISAEAIRAAMHLGLQLALVIAVWAIVASIWSVSHNYAFIFSGVVAVGARYLAAVWRLEVTPVLRSQHEPLTDPAFELARACMLAALARGSHYPGRLKRAWWRLINRFHLIEPFAVESGTVYIFGMFRNCICIWHIRDPAPARGPAAIQIWAIKHGGKRGLSTRPRTRRRETIARALIALGEQIAAARPAGAADVCLAITRMELALKARQDAT